MAHWTDQDILRLDETYARAGIAFHARPLRAALDLLGDGFVLGVGGNSAVRAICDAYARLIPEVDTTWPGLGIGLAASVDRVRKVTVAVALGNPGPLTIERALGFGSRDEWLAWCRGDTAIAAGNAFSMADVYDFAYGVNDIGADSVGAEYWRLAMSNLEDVANILPGAFSVDSVLQPICMTAELAMKACAAHLGVGASELKDLGHRHARLAARLAALKPHRDDTLVAIVVARLPNYVGSRYQAAGMTRLDVVNLALAAQFVAASTVRRLTDRDLALEMEQDSWPGPRAPFV